MGHLGHFQAGGDEDLCRVSGASATGWLKEEEEASGRSTPAEAGDPLLAEAVPPALTASSLMWSLVPLTGSSTRHGATSLGWSGAHRLRPPAPLPEDIPSLPPVSTCHTNSNHHAVPEHPPRCAALFIAKQTALRSPDKLLRGINKAKD